MLISLQENLQSKYPILRDVYIGCGDGWFWLLDFTFKCITNHYKWTSKHKEYPLRVAQVKEKFGQLNIYFDCADDYIYGVSDFAEKISGKICEVCGELGKIRNKGTWLKTLCDSHVKELGYENDRKN